MGYEIKCDMEESRGLAVWLVAMTGLAGDVETHDGDIIVGQIDKVKPYEHNGATFGMLQVDEEGRAVRGGFTKRIKVNDVKVVNIW